MQQLKKILSQIYSYIIIYFNKFVSWRKRRYERWKALPWQNRIINVILTSIVLFFIYLFLVDINFLWLFGKSPSLRTINNPPKNYTTEVISADNKLLGKFFHENRVPVTFNQISPKLINTLICTEDERFYKHFGIDFKGLFSAANDMTKGRARGASTITQQLVKNLFKTRNQYSTGLFGYIPIIRLIIMKTKEWISAVKIEAFYTKHDILTMYLNTVDFGNNAYGIYTASKTYFNTNPSQLNYLQSSMLVGLLKATSKYNPITRPDKCIERRNVVLDNLVVHNFIDDKTNKKLKAMPLGLNLQIEKPSNEPALYFKTYLKKYLAEWEKENNYDIEADGLKIYVTLDTRMQKYAEEAVHEHMKKVQKRFFEHWGNKNPWTDEQGNEIPGFLEDNIVKTISYRNIALKYKENQDSIRKYLNIKHKTTIFDYDKGVKDTVLSVMDSLKYISKFLHAGFVSMEPDTRFVRTWVGDLDYNTWQYDKVGQSKRQPGSTFKLFTYGSAFENGLNPCDKRRDTMVVWKYKENGVDKQWAPKNSTSSFTNGTYTLKQAFSRSMNSIAVEIARETGIKKISAFAHAMGIKTELEENASLCLGASDVSLLELTNAYCTAVNEGKYKEPILVTKILDHDDKVIYEYDQTEKQVISYETAWLLTDLLQCGMHISGGIIQALFEWRLFGYNTDFGGKTGTSSNNSDAWFVGVTPKLVGGVWVGGDQRSIHFRSGVQGEASRVALPVYALFMEKLLADEEFKNYRKTFPKEPKETIIKTYDCTPVYVQPDTTLSDSLDLEIDTTLPEAIDTIVPELNLEEKPIDN